MKPCRLLARSRKLLDRCIDVVGGGEQVIDLVLSGNSDMYRLDVHFAVPANVCLSTLCEKAGAVRIGIDAGPMPETFVLGEFFGHHVLWLFHLHTAKSQGACSMILN